MVVICLLAFNRVATRPKIHNKLTRGERVIAGSSPGLRISTAMEEDDERREAAIASSPALQPNFTPKKGLSPAQISKFQCNYSMKGVPCLCLAPPLPEALSSFISRYEV